jgi:hypothetical protein
MTSLIDVQLALNFVWFDSAGKIRIIMKRSKAFREDNEFLSRNVVLFDCLADEHFGDSLL